MLRWVVGALALGLVLVDALAGTVMLYTVLTLIGAVLIVAAPPAGLVALILAALASVLVDGWLLILYGPLVALAVAAARRHRRQERQRQIEADRADRLDRYVRQQLGE